jgi:hypothetical protein
VPFAIPIDLAINFLRKVVMTPPDVENRFMKHVYLNGFDHYQNNAVK